LLGFYKKRRLSKAKQTTNISIQGRNIYPILEEDDGPKSSTWCDRCPSYMEREAVGIVPVDPTRYLVKFLTKS
jgi:hypothetical protein